MPLPAIRRPLSRLRTVLSVSSVAVCLAALAGCSALGGSTSQSPDQGSGSAVEHANLKVGVLPIVDCAAIQRAQAAGYFKAEGLNVQLVPVQSGAIALPQVISGDLDLTWTNWTSVILAVQKKVADLRVLNASYQAAPNAFLIMARPESNIRTAQDMVGKKFAVNGFGSITDLIGRSALQTNGVDPKSVQFVEVPFADMPAALQNHQVDAALLLEPFLTQAATAGAVTVLDAASGPTSEIPIAGVAATAKFATENPKTLAAFQRAVGKAQADMADRSIVEQTLPTYTKITPATAPLLKLGSWPPTIDPTRLQRVADLMLQFGFLKQPFDVKPMLAATPTG